MNSDLPDVLCPIDSPAFRRELTRATRTAASDYDLTQEEAKSVLLRALAKNLVARAYPDRALRFLRGRQWESAFEDED